MGAMASQITSLTIVYSIAHSGADQIKKKQRSASLAFLRGIRRWPVNSTHKCPITRKMFPFDDVHHVIGCTSCCVSTILYDVSRTETTTVLDLTIDTSFNKRKIPGFGRHILLTKIHIKVHNKPIGRIRYDGTVRTQHEPTMKTCSCA